MSSVARKTSPKVGVAGVVILGALLLYTGFSIGDAVDSAASWLGNNIASLTNHLKQYAYPDFSDAPTLRD